MATRDGVDRIGPRQAVVPFLRTASFNVNDAGISAIDTQGFEAATLMLNIGAIDAAGIFTFTLQECDTTGGTYTDVANSDLIGGAQLAAVSTANTSANRIYALGYKGNKRFLGVRMVASGTVSTGVNVGAVIELDYARHLGGSMNTLVQ